MILTVNGPNLNLLGERNREVYGERGLAELREELEGTGRELGVKLLFFQSNGEGKMLDFLQSHRKVAEGVLINPGAFTHYSYALRDCLEGIELPLVEVHLSDIEEREDFRSRSVLDDLGLRLAQIKGRGFEGYHEGLHLLVDHLRGG